MNRKFLQITFLTLLFIPLIIILGCGGGGGGGGTSVAATAAPTASIVQSEAAKNFVARQIAGNFSNPGDIPFSGSRRLPASLRSAKATELGIGRIRIVFDTRDEVYLWGAKYTYKAGYQDYIARDSFGNYSNNENLINSLEISPVNMACEIFDNGYFLDLVYNGKLTVSGLNAQKRLTIRAENLNVSGSINGIDRISWTINGEVTTDEQSYPYPVKGSAESGTLVFNNETFSYLTLYNGTNLATVKLTGAENIEMTINLATGAVVSVGSQTATADSNLVGSWKLIEEDRGGQMLPVKPNASGQVSQVHFYANGTFKIENIERVSNSSINYWQSQNISPVIITGNFTFAGTSLKLQSSNETVSHQIFLNDTNFMQINPYQERFNWQKI